VYSESNVKKRLTTNGYEIIQLKYLFVCFLGIPQTFTTDSMIQDKIINTTRMVSSSPEDNIPTRQNRIQ
jgi:hypothetical protein